MLLLQSHRLICPDARSGLCGRNCSCSGSGGADCRGSIGDCGGAGLRVENGGIVDLRVDVHDGVDVDEYEGEECKSIEAGLRRTFSTSRSAFPGKTTGRCGGKVLCRKRGAGCQKQRFQLEECRLD